MARGVDEEERAVDTRVLDVTVALCGELLAKVGTVLVLDVLDNGVPAVVASEKAEARKGEKKMHQFSLLTWSPYPGVSTMLRRSRTPFSVMTE